MIAMEFVEQTKFVAQIVGFTLESSNTNLLLSRLGSSVT